MYGGGARNANAPSLGESNSLSAAHDEPQLTDRKQGVLTGAVGWGRVQESISSKTPLVFKYSLQECAEKSTDGLRGISVCLPFYPLALKLSTAPQIKEVVAILQGGDKPLDCPPAAQM